MLEIMSWILPKQESLELSKQLRDPRKLGKLREALIYSAAPFM
jgi:hypothetical protein